MTSGVRSYTQSSVSPEAQPLFYIGSSPSMAERLGEKATGVMISVNQLRKRRSDTEAEDNVESSGDRHH